MNPQDMFIGVDCVSEEQFERTQNMLKSTIKKYFGMRNKLDHIYPIGRPLVKQEIKILVLGCIDRLRFMQQNKDWFLGKGPMKTPHQYFG